MNIGTWDVLSPFEPPHLDAVTGLGIIGNQLVSGSKDKNLKLWSLDHAVNNNIQTLHTFNDYITTLHCIYFFIKALLINLFSMLVQKMDKSNHVSSKMIKLKCSVEF